MLFSLIITFRNEGEQVYKTCLSFLKHCQKEMFEFVIVNDASNDGYDYSELRKFSNLTYIENKDRKGVGGSRDIGALNAKGKYLLILDGHMRVFEDVLQKIANIISKYPKETLFCCQSIPIKTESDGKLMICNSPRSRGCKIRTKMDIDFLEYEWDRLSNIDEMREVLPIQCVMGADYVINKDYYLYLHGLNGLQQYGMDEQFLSAKVYMSGGNIYLLKNIGVAHFYRRSTEDIPYKNVPACKILNKMIILYLFDNTLFNQYSKLFYSKSIFNVFIELKPYLDKEKIYLNLILNKHTFDEYLKWKTIL